MKTPEEIQTQIDNLLEDYNLRNIGRICVTEELFRVMQDYAREACEEFITWYAKKYEMKFTDEFKKKLIDEFYKSEGLE